MRIDLIIIALIILGTGGLLFSNNSSQQTSINEDVVTSQVTIIPTITTHVPEPTTTPTYIECKMHESCGGGTKKLTLAQCNNSTCCQIEDKWFFYMDKNECTRDQTRLSSLTSKKTVKIKCSYSSDDYNYDYGELTYDECKVKTDEYWKTYKVKIDCSYSSGEYQYDFGKLTYDECTIKKNDYWDKKKKELTNQGNVIPTSSAEQDAAQAAQWKMEYEACRADARSSYSRNMNICAAGGAADSFGVGGCSKYQTQLDSDYRYCNSYYKLCMGADDCIKYGP